MEDLLPKNMGLIHRLNTIITTLSFTYMNVTRGEYIGAHRVKNATRNLKVWRDRI